MNLNEPNKAKEVFEKNQNTTEAFAIKIDKQLELHGDIRIDPYYWLNDRENPKVIEYLKQENEYLENVLAPVKPLRDTLYDEMLSRIQQEDQTVPYPMGTYLYYIRHEHGKEYSIYCRKKRNIQDAEEEIILDVNKLAEGQKFCHVIPPKLSPDENKMVFGLDTTGRNLHKAFVKDLRSGEMIETIHRIMAGDFVWTPDNHSFYYNTKDAETLRADQIWLHTLGSAVDQDPLIYHEPDETTYVSISSSKDRSYLFIHCGYTENVECHFLRMDGTDSLLQCMKPRVNGFYYSVDYFDHHFYILHNDQAVNFKISKANVLEFSFDQWTDIITHSEEVLIQDMEFFDKYLVIHERSNGLNQIRIHPWSGAQVPHFIRFPDASYDCWLGANKELDTDVLRLHYTSLTTPSSTFDYHIPERKLELLKEHAVLGNFDKENYQSEYFKAPGRDGTLIPISLVYRKGFEKNGKAPLLLNAYGSYGISYDPVFSSNALSLLDRGFVLAIAHIRGGKENGWHWYEKGKMFHKMNTFYDYIDCAEFLIREHYTTNERLFARGGSAGGLLMGVLLNLRPDLFKGILAHVPFVDVLTTMSDPNIPLTTGEYNEWGNPEIKEQYDYMKSYSPYDQVEEKEFTNVLITTGFSDSQVQYWEPAKWVAKLRTHRTDKHHLLLFHTNLDAGHGGASGRFERLKEVALDYAFMILLAEKQQ
ncbi:MAG: S9 family peptidase [Saprospiraceae bacterium]|nr:S9 family peptidase [Saprospiraceae bacterium]